MPLWCGASSTPEDAHERAATGLLGSIWAGLWRIEAPIDMPRHSCAPDHIPALQTQRSWSPWGSVQRRTAGKRPPGGTPRPLPRRRRYCPSFISAISKRPVAARGCLVFAKVVAPAARDGIDGTAGVEETPGGCRFPDKGLHFGVLWPRLNRLDRRGGRRKMLSNDNF